MSVIGHQKQVPGVSVQGGAKVIADWKFPYETLSVFVRFQPWRGAARAGAERERERGRER